MLYRILHGLQVFKIGRVFFTFYFFHQSIPTRSNDERLPRLAKIGRGVGCRVRRGFPFTTAGCDRKEAVKAECYHRALLQIPGEFQTPTEMNKSISCSMCLYMCSSGWNVLQTETEMTWKKYFVYNVLVHV